MQKLPPSSVPIELLQLQINYVESCDEKNIGKIPQNCAEQAGQKDEPAVKSIERKNREKTRNIGACQSFEFSKAMKTKRCHLVVFELCQNMFEQRKQCETKKRL